MHTLDNTHLLFMMVGMVIGILLTQVFPKNSQSRERRGNPNELVVRFNESDSTRIHLVKQRCEYSSEIDVVKKAVGLFDALTDAATKGMPILVGDRILDLFPLKKS